MSATRIVDIASLPGAGEADERASRIASRLPDGLAPLARIALDYRWAWDPDGPELFRSLDPLAWELNGRNPVRQLEDLAAARFRGSRRPTTRFARPGRPPRPRPRGEPRATGGPGRGARRACRVRLRRVRHPPVAADLLGRARRARRRHPQAGERPGGADDRRRPPLPQGLLPAARRPQRLQHEYWTQIVPEHLPTVQVLAERRRAAPPLLPALRSRGRVPRLAGGGRSRAALPARHRARRERPPRPLDHGAPLRGQPADAPRPVRPPRHRRRAGAAGARHRPRRAALQRGAPGARGARARRRGRRRRRARSTTRSRPRASGACSRRTRPCRRATRRTSPPRFLDAFAELPVTARDQPRAVPRSLSHAPGRPTNGRA